MQIRGERVDDATAMSEAKAMIQDADDNSDGVISFDEFLQYVQREDKVSDLVARNTVTFALIRTGSLMKS